MYKFFVILAFVFLISCAKQPSEIKNSEKITSFKTIEEVFHNPPKEYRTAPFWVWNNAVSKEDIYRTLYEFKDKGMGGAFLHPRYGLVTEYLSDEWWELTDYALQVAKELDLNLWLYDENSFPSGFAGGHVPDQMPESYNQGIALIPHFMDVLEINPKFQRVKHVFVFRNNNWEEITEDYKSQIGQKGKFCILELKNPDKSKWYGGFSYTDLLVKGVTEKFIDITMAGYEKTIGEEFGQRVPGIFTDEPNISTGFEGAIRYTPDLYTAFETEWGYKLEPYLLSLVTKTGNWQKVRHNYYSTLLNLFIDRWSKPWYKYTEEKGLAWTGHYWEHGWPSPNHGGDNMAMYAWHQVPAIDMLFNAEESRPDQFGNIRAVKELASVANQFGRHRTLSETYGASGWELTFEDMKRLGDWEFALGVNFMNQHLAYMSLAGDRKHDFPQSFGTHAPYWGLYKYQADYFARLSLALSSGKQNNSILVMEPTSSAWMLYNPSGPNTKMNILGNRFEDFLGTLEKEQIEYDLGCENIIKGHGSVINNQLAINKSSYSMVVLPPGITNLDKPTFHLLKQYVESGGTLIAIDANLTTIDGSKSDALSTITGSENFVKADSLNEKIIADYFRNQNITFENPSQITGQLFHQRRELDDGQLLFLSNFDKLQSSEAIIHMPGKSVIELNSLNGKIEPSVFTKSKGNLSFKVSLEPAESKLLFISNKTKKSKELVEEELTIENLQPSTIQTITPNILNLDYVSLTMAEYKAAPMFYYEAANKIWNQHGFPDNPWVSSSQFKTELIDADTFKDGTGFKVCYPFYISEGYSTENMELVVERPWLYTISVNGHDVTQIEDKTWLDPDFKVFEISDVIKEGQNIIALTSQSIFRCFAKLNRFIF